MLELPSDFAEFLENEARTAVAAIHQFMESPHRFTDAHLFVEGDHDGAYYAEHVRKVTGMLPHHYVCGGKSEVIQAYNDLLLQRSTERLFFFVDRDHQDFVGGQGVPNSVYITDFYSFESNLTNADYVSRFLAESMNLPASNALHRSIMTAYLTAEASFCKEARPLIAVALAVREKRGKLNLNNLDLDKAFSLSPTGVFRRNRAFTKNAIRSMVVDWAGANQADVLRWNRALSLASRLNWMRGKYLFWALFRYLKQVAISVAAARKAVGSRRGRVPANLSNLNAFTETAFALVTPGSLSAALS